MGIEWFMRGRYRARDPLLGSLRATQHGHTGKCVPLPIGLAEAEDDEMCIGVALHAFTNEQVEPSPIATSGARKICVRNLVDFSPLVMAGLLATGLSAQAGSRVIVSTTLDSTLAIFEADPPSPPQPPPPPHGGG